MGLKNASWLPKVPDATPLWKLVFQKRMCLPMFGVCVCESCWTQSPLGNLVVHGRA